MTKSVSCLALLATVCSGGCLTSGEDWMRPMPKVYPVGKTRGQPVVFEDFESSSAASGSAWYVYSDKHGLGTTAFYDPDNRDEGAHTKRNCGRFHGYLGTDEAPFAWSTLTTNFTSGYVDIDLRAVRAVRFWVRGDGKTYSVALASRDGSGMSPTYRFVAHEEWTQYEVPVRAFELPAWSPKPAGGITYEKVAALQFAPQTFKSSYDIYIDDIELVVDPAGPALPFKGKGSVSPDAVPHDQYAWNQIPVGPFGYSTWLLIHPKHPEVKYLGTDVGGVYGWRPARGGKPGEGRWQALMDGLSFEPITLPDYWLPTPANFVRAMEFDPADDTGKSVYVMTERVMFKTTDGGETWKRVHIHATFGEGTQWNHRLAADPTDGKLVFAGTENEGLWRSRNGGAEWEQVPTEQIPLHTDPKRKDEYALLGGRMGISFVAFDPGDGRTIYVGVRGRGVYQSLDHGEHFKLAKGAGREHPPWGNDGIHTMEGVVASDGTLYVTFVKGPHYYPTDGAIWRFDGGRGSSAGRWVKITPPYTQDDKGWNAITTRGQEIWAASWAFGSRRTLWYSPRRGQPGTWVDLTPDPDKDVKYISAAALRTFPASPSRIALDPEDPKALWIVDGMGTFRASENTRRTTWIETADGEEEFCSYDLLKPPGSKTLFTGVGDLVGFSIDTDNLGRRQDAKWHPYTHNRERGQVSGHGGVSSLTTTPVNPRYIARVGKQTYPDDVWFNEFSTDGGQTWTAFGGHPPGQPGNKDEGNYGILVASATGHHDRTAGATVPDVLVWKTVGQKPPGSPTPFYSTDNGKTWKVGEGITADTEPGTVLSQFGGFGVLAADAVDGKAFYYFNWNVNGTFYNTIDGGKTWRKVLTGMPTWGSAQLRALPGERGGLFLASGVYSQSAPGEGSQGWGAGLIFAKNASAAHPVFKKIAQVDWTSSIAFGKPAPNRANPTMFVAGKVNGVSGLFRSDDVTAAVVGDDDPTGTNAIWVLVAGARDFVEQTGRPLPVAGVTPRLLEGDPDVYGRVFAGSGCRGLFFGEPR